jgi:hypothetical protein
MPASCPARAQLAARRPARSDLIVCCLPAERRLSVEDAKGSGNILNWQPAVSKAKKQPAGGWY